MRIYDVIANKRDGKTLTPEELHFFVQGAVQGRWADYQVSAMLMAMCIRGMTREETATLTMEMAKSGEMLDLSTIPGIKVDKHSTGGVGDKVTLAVAPICAALGVPIAKMSGRGLGYTGGTVDKLESISGYRTELMQEEFLQLVRKNGLSIIGQSGDICPADKLFYALRDVSGCVESIPLIVSSIMSKKIAAGADAIVLDVKVGSGAFMKNEQDARTLAQEMIAIGQACGRKTAAVLSDMSVPLGQCIGNALEVQEVIQLLQGHSAPDLWEECETIAAMMLYVAEKGSLEQCRALVRGAVQDGSAWAKFLQLVQAQGGQVQDGIPVLRSDPVQQVQLTAESDGWVQCMDALACGKASVALGAGREKKSDSLNYSAGLVLHAKPGQQVQAGQPLVTLYGRDEAACKEALELLRPGVQVGQQPPEQKPHVLDILGVTDI